mgnify:CR=1 FL=1
MVNASGHIEQQLSKLQTQTADIATELESLVDKYLDILSQASKRQLVLAAYHICTQIYPESFLELSLSQRDRLQKKLRELGNSIQAELDEKWKTAKQFSLRPAEEDGLAVIRQLFLEAASARDESEANKGDVDKAEQHPAQEQDDVNTAEQEPPAKRSQEQLLADIRTLIGTEPTNVAPSEDEAPGPMQPAQIMRRQILIEKAIRDVLKAVSEKANEVLQQAQVMPEVPHALLAAASESERLGHIPMKTPNLVRLAIKILHEPDKSRFTKDDEQSDIDDDDTSDIDDEPKVENWSDGEISAAIIAGDDVAEREADESEDERSKEPMSMPRFLQLESLPDFVMIHLRLSEIEFAETNVAVWRSRIRKKMAHLKHVGHAYKNAERQLAIAQAEDAWRASWTND